MEVELYQHSREIACRSGEDWSAYKVGQWHPEVRTESCLYEMYREHVNYFFDTSALAGI